MYCRPGGVAGCTPRFGIGQPVLQCTFQLSVAARHDCRVGVDEDRGVATGVMARAEQDRRAEGGWLQDGMQARGVESATDERDVGECVEVAEHADTIDDDDVGAGCLRVAQLRRVESFSRCPALEWREMRWRGLVRRDDEAWCLRSLTAREPGPRGKQLRLIRGPGGTGNEGETIAGEWCEQLAVAIHVLR